MTHVATVAEYRPVWEERGARVPGPDEDVTTLAVAAGRLALDGTADVARVVLVVSDPDYVDGAPLPVLTRGLGLASEVVAELRIGGASAALDAVATAADTTLVLGVTTGRDTAGAAVLTGAAGVQLDAARSVAGSLPMRVRRLGSPAADVYADGRVERELGWRAVIDVLADKYDSPVLVGVPAKDAQRLGGRALDGVGPGPAGALVALGVLAGQGAAGRVIAVDGALGSAVTVAEGGGARVARDVRAPLPAASRPRVRQELAIPFSMPSYDRAFEQKLSLVAARCPECGTEAYPHRERCLGCGRVGEDDLFALPRSGEVYSTVTVHAPVPGVSTPRGIAVVSLPPTTVRVLAHVTDVMPDGCSIGGRGDLVLRLVAVREGIPDYGYAFRPEVTR